MFLPRCHTFRTPHYRFIQCHSSSLVFRKISELLWIINVFYFFLGMKSHCCLTNTNSCHESSFYYSSIQHTHQIRSFILRWLQLSMYFLGACTPCLHSSDPLTTKKLLRHLPWTLPRLHQYIIVTNRLLCCSPQWTPGRLTAAHVALCDRVESS